MSMSIDSNKLLLRKGDMKLDNYPTCAVEALTRLGKVAYFKSQAFLTL